MWWINIIHHSEMEVEARFEANYQLTHLHIIPNFLLSESNNTRVIYVSTEKEL